MPDGSGRFAYVLASHLDPLAVLATARRIKQLSPDAAVLVRHARRPDWLTAAQARDAGAEVLHSSIEMRWGTWNMVSAVLEALAAARSRFQPDHTVVVSGQDHPVVDLAAWQRSVLAEGADALLRPDDQDYSDRYRSCWHDLPTAHRVPDVLPRTLRGLGAHLPARVGRLHLAGERTWAFTHPRPAGDEPPVPYRKGSLWSTLSAAAVERLLAVDPSVRRWFATTLLPDESFVHSVLGADPQVRISPRPTTTAFFPADDLAHPRAVRLEDLPAVRASGAAFARKVVPGLSDEFVLAVDAAVDAGRSAALS